MNQVTVNKRDLVDRLRINMEAHRAKYEDAMIGFKIDAVKQLEELIEDVEDGREIEGYIRLTIPEDHTEDYQRALEMLDWDLAEVVTVTRDEFTRFVQDDWGWKQSFEASTSIYNSTTYGGSRPVTTGKKGKATKRV